MRRFLLLVTHFFGRFFDNEIVSQQGDMRTNAVQALGLIASPGIIVSFFMLPQGVRCDRPFAYGWELIGDYYFFVVYSMIVMGFLMVLEWDALFPDRKDYLVLTPLPIGGSAIFAAKIAALALFMAVFVVGANLFGAVLTPAVSAPPRTPGSTFFPLLGAHVLAVAAGGLFMALAIAGLQGILINVLPGRVFRRVSPWAQMAVMGALIFVLFLTPLVCAGLRRLFESDSGLLRLFPPFWFLACYVDLLPGRPGGAMFHGIAGLARSALGASGAVFALAYLAGYARHARRVMDSVETAREGPGPLRRRFDAFINRRLLPHPLERATFHFISNTILRTAKNRLFLAGYAAIALALALLSVVRIGTRPGAAPIGIQTAILAVVPLTLSFFAVSGLRAMFNFPAELRANWIFQVCESEERVAHIRAVRKWVLVFGIAPLFAALAPLEFALRGWRVALIHLSFALLLSLVLLNILLIWFRKIPFTCSYFPGKTNMVVSGVLYLFGFSAYSWSMAALVERLIRAPVKLAIFYAAILLLLRGLASFEKHELQVDDTLVYEDRPDPVVRTLELG